MPNACEMDNTAENQMGKIKFKDRHNWLMKNHSLLNHKSIVGESKRNCKYWWSDFHVCSCREVFCSKIFRNFSSVTLFAFLWQTKATLFHQFFDNGLPVRKEGNTLVLVIEHFLIDWSLNSLSDSISIFEFVCLLWEEYIFLHSSCPALDSLGLGYIFNKSSRGLWLVGNTLRSIAFYPWSNTIKGYQWCAQEKGL